MVFRRAARILKPGDFERQGQQILDPVEGRILLVQDQKNLLGDVVVAAFPSLI